MSDKRVHKLHTDVPGNLFSLFRPWGATDIGVNVQVLWDDNNSGGTGDQGRMLVFCMGQNEKKSWQE